MSAAVTEIRRMLTGRGLNLLPLAARLSLLLSWQGQPAAWVFGSSGS